MTDEASLPRPAPEGGEAVSKRKRVVRKARVTKRPAKKKAAPKRASAKTVKKAKAAARPRRGGELVDRVTRAIERELTQIESVVGAGKSTPARRTEAERRARTVASLARTLAEVTRLRATQRDEKASDDDDPVPRDLDEFRATLQRRLDQMVAAEQTRAAGGDDAG